MSSNGNGSAWVTGNAPNGSTISPLELESLTKLDEKSSTQPRTTNNAGLMPTESFGKLKLLIKLYFELYPRVMFGICGCLVTALLMWWAPWNSITGRKYTRNYMTADYSALEDNFSLQISQVDHWCLFGGSDKCTCNDPTEAESRIERNGWGEAHSRNKEKVQAAIDDGGVDVVFLGDQTIQAWDGRWLSRPAPEGMKIAYAFNKTFNTPSGSGIKGLPLGIYGDRVSNILWRVQHGEVPPELSPKVFWIQAGTNDLSKDMCSEEIVTLGIQRLAEELHHHYPDAVVVIQSILPRSNHKDGTLEGEKSKYRRPMRPTRIVNKDGLSSETIGSRHKAERTKDLGFGGIPAGGLGGRHLEEEREMMDIDDIEANIASYNRRLEEATGGATTPAEPATSTEETPAAPAEPVVSGTPPATPDPPPAPETSTTPASTPLRTTPTTKELRPQPISAGAGASNTRQGITWDEAKKMALENRSPYPKVDFYLWPSIKTINRALEKFCRKHEHFVYFDADDLILGSLGNAHFKAAHKTIIAELMPNYVHLSSAGHSVVLKAIRTEVERIIYDDDENNDIEAKGGGHKTSSDADAGK